MICMRGSGQINTHIHNATDCDVNKLTLVSDPALAGLALHTVINSRK